MRLLFVWDHCCHVERKKCLFKGSRNLPRAVAAVLKLSGAVCACAKQRDHYA